jgi:hypothetical protein
LQRQFEIDVVGLISKTTALALGRNSACKQRFRCRSHSRKEMSDWYKEPKYPVLVVKSLKPTRLSVSLKIMNPHFL